MTLTRIAVAGLEAKDCAFFWKPKKLEHTFRRKFFPLPALGWQAFDNQAHISKGTL